MPFRTMIALGIIAVGAAAMFACDRWVVTDVYERYLSEFAKPDPAWVECSEFSAAGPNAATTRPAAHPAGTCETARGTPAGEVSGRTY
ncbi:MAG TPA: hypothetical protein VH518_00660 [Tepidisphaeraceae bacterium]